MRTFKLAWGKKRADSYNRQHSSETIYSMIFIFLCIHFFCDLHWLRGTQHKRKQIKFPSVIKMAKFKSLTKSYLQKLKKCLFYLKLNLKSMLVLFIQYVIGFLFNCFLKILSTRYAKIMLEALTILSWRLVVIHSFILQVWQCITAAVLLLPCTSCNILIN